MSENSKIGYNLIFQIVIEYYNWRFLISVVLPLVLLFCCCRFLFYVWRQRRQKDDFFREFTCINGLVLGQLLMRKIPPSPTLILTLTLTQTLTLNWGQLSGHHMDRSRTRTEHSQHANPEFYKFCKYQLDDLFSSKIKEVHDNPPPPSSSVITTHCVRKSICDSSLIGFE